MAKNTGIKNFGDITTVLGPGTSLSGTLRFDTGLMIQGHFEGDIDAKGALYIDETAEVKARRIRAMSIVVAGSIKGDIEAADKVELRSTARIYGNITTSKLRIADGVLFEGRCEMIKDPANFNPFAKHIQNAQ